MLILNFHTFLLWAPTSQVNWYFSRILLFKVTNTVTAESQSVLSWTDPQGSLIPTAVPAMTTPQLTLRVWGRCLLEHCHPFIPYWAWVTHFYPSTIERRAQLPEDQPNLELGAIGKQRFLTSWVSLPFWRFSGLIYLPWVSTDAINALVNLKYHTATSSFTKYMEYLLVSAVCDGFICWLTFLPEALK